MQDQPSAGAMLAAIATMLRDEIVPRLDGRPAFQARVAANALDIVVRELQHAPAANAAERARLIALLGEEGSLEDLNRSLCRRIAAGELSLESPGLAEHLWATTLDKLAIDQPGYASFRRALAERRPPSSERT